MGVVIMALRVAVLFLYPLRANYITPTSNIGQPMWVVLFVLQAYLTFLGFSPIRQPFILMALMRTTVYFLYHCFNIVVNGAAYHCFRVVKE